MDERSKVRERRREGGREKRREGGIKGGKGRLRCS